MKRNVPILFNAILTACFAFAAVVPAVEHAKGADETAWRSPQFSIEVSWQSPWSKNREESVNGDYDMVRIAVPRMYQEFYGLKSAETDRSAMLYAFVGRFRADVDDMTVTREYTIFADAPAEPMMIEFTAPSGVRIIETLLAVSLEGEQGVYVMVDGREGDLTAGYGVEELGNLVHMPKASVPQASPQNTNENTSRYATATATCESEKITVAIENRIGRRLYVAFARAAVGAHDSIEDTTIENGASVSIDLPIEGQAEATGAALIVTNAGLLVPPCDGSASIDLGPRLTSDDERKAEWPAIAARTISNLEAIGAYDALYALLHADAKHLVTADQVACWYTEYMAGATTSEATVLDVSFGAWTWGVNSKTYDAAEIRYQQPYWVADVQEDRAGTEHLVLNGGHWRWFLGTDPAWLSSLPTACSELDRPASGAATTSWTSSQYGFTVSWQEPWYKVGEFSIPGEYDMLQIAAGDTGIVHEFYGVSWASPIDTSLVAPWGETMIWGSIPPMSPVDDFVTRFRASAPDIGISYGSPNRIFYRATDGTPVTETLNYRSLVEGESVYFSVMSQTGIPNWVQLREMERLVHVELDGESISLIPEP